VRMQKARWVVLLGVSLMATIATGALLLHCLAQQDLTTIAVGATAAASLVTLKALRAALDVPRRVDRRPLGGMLNGDRGFERRANVGAPLQFACRRGG
jgi:hypothetical protein